MRNGYSQIVFGQTMNDKSNDTTHFGYESVSVNEKSARVAQVFDSVADRYDLMNDMMSLGIHRLWKKLTLNMTGLRPGQKALDLAGGSGDMARVLARQVGKKGKVILSDINPSMLAKGRERLLNEGFGEEVEYVIADAEQLPFADNTFHCVTMAFGLRNVTDKGKALQSIFRVLKPGGRLLILEFSHLKVKALQPLYDAYSFKILPWLGKKIANDAASYRYLAESIRMHPDQESLKKMCLQAGFDACEYQNMSGGIVALHKAFKLS